VDEHADEAAETALDEQLEQSKGEDKCALPRRTVKNTLGFGFAGRGEGGSGCKHSRMLSTTLLGCECTARPDVERLRLGTVLGRLTSKSPPEQEWAAAAGATSAPRTHERRRSHGVA